MNDGAFDAAAPPIGSGAFDPTAPLVASGNLRRRQVLSRLAEHTATGAAALAVAVLAVVVYSVFVHGASALSLGFLVEDPPAGIAPAIVGTAIIVAIATAIAMPLGVLVALYLTEFGKGRAARSIRLTLDLMNGLPSIVIGLFVFGLLVNHRKQSGFAGSVALAIIMLPIVARGAQEMLLLVPGTLREAADALGVSRWRTMLGVVLPSALGGILTSTVLALARAAGETAPLIFLTSLPTSTVSLNPFQPLSNIPVTIFNLSEEANPAGFPRAWGAAFVLLAFILFANLGARALLARSRARLTS
jgi:phosphate transport system permease protein